MTTYENHPVSRAKLEDLPSTDQILADIESGTDLMEIDDKYGFVFKRLRRISPADYERCRGAMVEAMKKPVRASMLLTERIKATGFHVDRGSQLGKTGDSANDWYLYRLCGSYRIEVIEPGFSTLEDAAEAAERVCE